MGDIVNLREARRRKARERAEREASQNRRKHGVTKAEKANVLLVRTLEADKHAKHKRETLSGDDAGRTKKPSDEDGGSGI